VTKTHRELLVACSNHKLQRQRGGGIGKAVVVTSRVSHRALAFPGMVKAVAADQAGGEPIFFFRGFYKAQIVRVRAALASRSCRHAWQRHMALDSCGLPIHGGIDCMIGEWRISLQTACPVSIAANLLMSVFLSFRIRRKFL